MTRGNKILLVVLVVQVGLAALMLTRDRGGGLAPLAEVASKLDATKVSKLQIFDRREPGATAEDKPAVELTASGADWTLSSHFGFPADGGKVAKLLTDLSVMKARGPMTKGVARHAQLGVADADYERKVVITDDSGERVFYVGKGAGGRQTAVRRGGESQVFGVAGISAYAIDAEPGGWVAKTYTTVDTEAVAAIDVTAGGKTTSLDRTGGAWALLEGGAPVTEPVDATKADGLLEQLASITLVEPADPARDVSAPTATITLRMKAPPAPAPAAPTDAGVPAISEPPPPAPPPRTFDVLADGERYWVRERGNLRAVLVDKSALEAVIAMSRATLVTAPPPAAPPG